MFQEMWIRLTLKCEWRKLLLHPHANRWSVADYELYQAAHGETQKACWIASCCIGFFKKSRSDVLLMNEQDPWWMLLETRSYGWEWGPLPLLFNRSQHEGNQAPCRKCFEVCPQPLRTMCGIGFPGLLAQSQVLARLLPLILQNLLTSTVFRLINLLKFPKPWGPIYPHYAYPCG